VIEGTVWKPKTFKKPKLVGKFEIPLLAIKWSSQAMWVDLEADSDPDFVSPPSSPEIKVRLAHPLRPHSKKKKKKKKKKKVPRWKLMHE
jgi:hypothetical protein